ncbi:RNA polymerase sigma-70 factor [Chitinophaga nivalis]|uniref:RNA polymerase sigma-70 factor n=1 Tax=Chitinophaga nivalis TaxID=2991709 RepID=A0ABT3INF2_9BACT|nr:RNA polymerase sigma-70 factor [Chitinophaga nivalis]MCW3464814.1 RNA polymerase sigma-70 factor [Chitinophaga nivalis]MCW3485495.1 RNA polymerase sigma-70 factor [Chitinophaga nivalis]
MHALAWQRKLVHLTAMRYTELTDRELLERIKCDDIPAFETLYRRMWESLYLFAFRRLKSKADAEDVVQQVFMNIWENRATKNITGSFSNYIFTAVRYEVIDQLTAMLKDQQQLAHIQTHILPDFNEALENLLAKEMDKEIAQHIQQMPAQMQKIFRLSREAQMTPEEIAKTLSLSEKTVRNQLSMAVSNLRPLVKESLVLLLLLQA